ncbi:ankyrin repeat-containing protein, partial [Tanacetum coccineum]
VVYEEVVAAEDKRVISSVPELRQRTRFREDSMFQIDENVKDMDADLTSTSRLSNTERPEMNGHCVGRMLEKDKSLDWRQLLPDNDPNYNLDGSIDEPVEDGDTALHLTCLYGHLSCVQLLLERGASVEAKDEDGGVPLHDACAGGFMEIVQLLVGKVDSPECLKRMLESVDVEGDTPLHHAARGEHEAIVQLLLSIGASPTKTNVYGKTPGELAEPNTQTWTILEAATRPSAMAS